MVQQEQASQRVLSHSPQCPGKAEGHVWDMKGQRHPKYWYHVMIPAQSCSPISLSSSQGVFRAEE